MQNTIRYAQCWEDADVLLDALSVRSGHTCLAIASAGDNALALLARSPERVIAVDYNPAQIACLELRAAAYRTLDDEELLRFSGARLAWDRHILYRLCRPHLSAHARAFWDDRPHEIARGYLHAGRLERYFELFRTWLLPRVHDPETVAMALLSKPRAQREQFYDEVWNTRAWRLLFASFFSRRVMERIGRDPRYFRYAHGGIARRLEERVRHAFVDLDPACNPYLRWMLTGEYGEALPFALRAENMALIRANLDRLTWRTDSLQSVLADLGTPIDRYALSDVFEYVDERQYEELLRAVIQRSNPRARLVYWNMLVERTRPPILADALTPDLSRAGVLHENDKTFFYSRLVIEDVC